MYIKQVNSICRASILKATWGQKNQFTMWYYVDTASCRYGCTAAAITLCASSTNKKKGLPSDYLTLDGARCSMRCLRDLPFGFFIDSVAHYRRRVWYKNKEMRVKYCVRFGMLIVRKDSDRYLNGYDTSSGWNWNLFTI